MNGWTDSDIVVGAMLGSIAFFWVAGLPWYAAIPVGAVLALPMLMCAWLAFVLLSALIARATGWFA